MDLKGVVPTYPHVAYTTTSWRFSDTPQHHIHQPKDIMYWKTWSGGTKAGISDILEEQHKVLHLLFYLLLLINVSSGDCAGRWFIFPLFPATQQGKNKDTQTQRSRGRLQVQPLKRWIKAPQSCCYPAQPRVWHGFTLLSALWRSVDSPADRQREQSQHKAQWLTLIPRSRKVEGSIPSCSGAFLCRVCLLCLGFLRVFPHHHTAHRSALQIRRGS